MYHQFISKNIGYFQTLTIYSNKFSKATVVKLQFKLFEPSKMSTKILKVHQV